MARILRRAIVLLPAAACVAIWHLLAPGDGLAQTNVPPAPAISSVTAGDGSLTVAWNAPSGPTVTAYDLRHVRTSDDETDAAAWTLDEDVWSSGYGSLEHTITGVENGVQYDIQVRGVNANGDGGWSSTVTGRPADHGDNRATATEIGVNAPVVGLIGSDSDEDYFQITLSEASDIFVYTTSYISGFLSTTGELQDSSGAVVKADDRDSVFRQYGPQLFLWDTLEAGTYYVKVGAPETGAYTLHAQTVRETTSTGDAVDLAIDGFADGVLDPALDDEDFFRIELSQESDLMIRLARAQGGLDTEGALLTSDGEVLAVRDDSFLGGDLDKHFIIREKMEAGVYYLRVRTAQEGVLQDLQSVHAGVLPWSLDRLPHHRVQGQGYGSRSIHG